jgi:hypothetical protein
MRKYPIVFLLALINPISCSNFALPEQVHVKAEINPTVPVNNSGRFDFSKQFQEALNAMFSSSLGEDEKNAVKVFDYRGDEDDVQKFLIAFSLKEQTLDFKEYFSRDLNLDSGFQNIKQTFKLDELTAAENSKISLDMSDTISDILGTIKFPNLRVPCTAGPEFNSPSIPVEVEGFISLSFYDGYLAARFSFNGSGEVRLRNLRVNSSIPSVPSSCTVTPNNPQEVRFPLKGKTLEKSFSLSFSYASTGDGELASAIGFSDDVRIKTAKGVSFNPINGARFEDSEIALSVPPEFVQAKIGSGSISMDASALKGVNLDLGGMRITQELNEDAPSYQDPDSTALLELKEGLGSLTPRSGKFDLAGQKFNPKAIKISGAYSMTADQNSAEITFTEDKKLEIPVSFAMERFDEVYVNGQTIIDEFNQKSGKMEEPLDNLSQTVSSITIKDAGVKLTFGNCIDGLKLHIESEQFKVDETDFIEPGTTKSFTTLSTNVNTKPFPLDITENSTITIDLKLEGNGTIPVLQLPPMASGENVAIIDCTPEVVFDWEAAAIKLREAFTKGRLPESGKGFSLDGKDLKTFMNNIEIDERIIAYFFLSGPQGLKGDDMTLILTSFPGTDWEISLAKEH